MSAQVRVEEWLRKMGYDGAIPSGLSKICNPSTAFVWEQLITNVKSRQEVEHKRKNIIVNRLSQPLEHQDQFSYPIREVQVYVQKQACDKRINYLEKEIEEKEEIIDKSLDESNVKSVAISNTKARIKEIKQRKFLLDKKSKLIEEDIQRAQEVLTLARNLTPVEMEASANTDEITQTLQKCAEKLRKLSEAICPPKTKKNRSMATFTRSTTRTARFRKNTFSQYLNQSTTLADIVPSCKKSSVAGKENFHFRQQGALVNRCLKFASGDEVDKGEKRESLGLLSDNCLNTSEEVDAFLLSPLKMMNSLSDSVFEPTTNTNFEILEKLRGDDDVKEILANLLHKNNRYLIVSRCKSIYEELLNEIRTPIMECNKLISLDRNVDQADLTELYFIHLKSELEKEKCRIILKNLQEAAKRKKETVLNELCSKSRNRDEITQMFELQIEDAFLTGANNFLRKERNSSKKLDSDYEVPMINARIKQAKEEIVVKSSCIESLISNTCKVLDDIKRNREETCVYVKKLNPYIHDETWVNVMRQKDHSEEIDLFKKFPIEYNRKLRHNNVKISHTAVSDTTVPPYVKLDSNDLEQLTRVMSVPFATSENAIFDLLQTRVSSNKLRSPQMPSSDATYHTYASEDLRLREGFVEPTMAKLRTIINSSEVREVLGGPNYMKQMTALRVEMPFRNFISEKRQVEGQGYKHYENELNKLKKA